MNSDSMFAGVVCFKVCYRSVLKSDLGQTNRLPELLGFFEHTVESGTIRKNERRSVESVMIGIRLLNYTNFSHSWTRRTFGNTRNWKECLFKLGVEKCG